MTLHLTAGERERLEARAASMGMHSSRLARLCALGDPLPPPVPVPNLTLWRELGRLAGNLNQWVHAVHTGVLDPPPVDLHVLIGLVAALRDDLRGRRG